ncbi:MAG: aromatic ring-hydroxylating dioxygenase subunit alpha [Rhodobacterales bacterium]|nr:aromatic ring-hydroxylating dioxygenase subunit alpha [Rhodobacterales bacterium]
MDQSIVSLRSRDCTFGENNWSVLAKFWHPVAWSDELTDAPLGRKLLDVAVVLFRDAEGRAVAAHDVCPHRGSLLSQGTTVGGELVCPYHGMRYAGSGRCTMIPSNRAGVKIPDRLHLRLIEIAEHANLIWVRLDSSGQVPLPEWRELGNGDWQTYHLEPLVAKTSATRICENFNDVAHFAFVHTGTFANGVREEVEAYELVRSDYGLHQQLMIEQVDRVTLDSAADRTTSADYTYDFQFPFANKMHIKFDAKRSQHIFGAVTPVSSNESRLFMQFARNYDLDQPIADSLDFERAVSMEDLRIIEKVTPVDVPLDLTEEFSVAADKWSVAFRRQWRQFGLVQ